MERKKVFTINLDSDKVIDFDTFIIRKENEELAKWGKELNDSRFATFKKSLKLSVIPWFTGLIGFLCLRIALKLSGGFATTVWLAAGLFLALTVLSAILLHRHNKKKEKEAEKRYEEEYASYREIVQKELHVPRDAKEVEIFTNMYVEDDPIPSKIYSNDTVTVFGENGYLCFLYGSTVLGFPLSELEGLVKVEKEILFDCWGRDESYDSQQFLPYNIREINDDQNSDYYYSMQGYYSLHLTRDGTPYEILVAPYDIAPIQEILAAQSEME